MVNVCGGNGGMDGDVDSDAPTSSGIFIVRAGECLFVSPDKNEIAECLEVQRGLQETD